eukprot:6943892-Ditylum_brightwellii.AAC.1
MLSNVHTGRADHIPSRIYQHHRTTGQFHGTPDRYIGHRGLELVTIITSNLIPDLNSGHCWEGCVT